MNDSLVNLPVRAVLTPEGLHVALREIDAAQLRDPFMQETVQRVRARELIAHVPKNTLGVAPPETAPAGMIFHVARCGSTLVSQLLKEHPRLVVYSEPLPFNELLVPPHKHDRSDLVAALRSLGGLFSRHARGPYVIKLTSWNTLFCDLLAEAFPKTPWAICTRDPVEVCVSLLQQRPGWLKVANTADNPFVDVVDRDRMARTPEEYVARYYAASCTAAAKLEAKRGAILRYETLPDAVWETLVPHFGLSVDDQVRSRMAAASQTYAKAPQGREIQFVPDGAAKRAAASADLLRAIDAFARPALARLVSNFDGDQTRPDAT